MMEYSRLSRFLLNSASPFQTAFASIIAVYFLKDAISGAGKGTHLLVTAAWLGGLCSISWLESWVKFESVHLRANRHIAIDVGRHVFSAFGLVEVVLSCFAVYQAYLREQTIWSAGMIAPVCVALQAILIRPMMRTRSALIVAEKPLPEVRGVPGHLLFVIVEVVKTAGLIYTAISLL